ncbi:GGDEF domain-containing protein [Vibrio fluvialis]|uniref:GGDEF domain-containing protein n=1 Tax=Vibrio fluvialis TaxID=676 RepID=UPI001C9C0E2E|nr:GGDEF domain-containing protein [Vibrio fluvialis]MBY8094954.1 GGDEF domain-containing protein [Vibrio fluvialis]
MDARLFDNSHTLRASVLAGLSLFLTGIALFFTIFNISYNEAYVLAGLEFLFAFYSGYIYRLTTAHKHTHRHIQYYVYFLITIIGVGSFMQPLGNGLFLWTIFCPILLYVLLGQSHGRLMTGVVLIIQIFNVYHNATKVDAFDTVATLVNLILCYVGVWTVSHIYETSRHNIENSLTYLASRDSLTGAHNRLSLTSAFNHFEKNKDDASSLCLLIIDLDYFKQVNDEFGHDTGDKVLIETTQLLSQIVGDNNLFRIGGEEFCVTLFDQGLEQAERVGERLRYVIGQHLYNYRNQRIQLTLSVGICEYRDGDNLSDLLKLADVELYRAKKNGRNQVRLCQISDKREHSMQTESV